MYFLCGEKRLILADRFSFCAGNFIGEGVAAVVEISGGDAFNAGKCDGIGEQGGALHANADYAETETVACGDRGFQCGGNVLRLGQDVARDSQSSGSARGFLQELPTSGFPNASGKRVNRD